MTQTDGAATDWLRLDPRMLLIHPIREVLRFLPVLLGLFIAGTASGGRSWQYLGVLIPIALGVLRYLTTRYRIADGRVELRRGLLSRHVLSTPVDRVRTVDLTSSPIHRVLGLTTVRVGTGTASAEGDDGLDLDGLPVAQARQLRAELLPVGEPQVQDPEEPGAAPMAAPEREVLRFDPAWIRFAPLTSSGLVIAAGVLGVGSQLVSQIDLFDDVDPAAWSTTLPVGVAVALGVLAAGAAVVVLGVIGYAVTNWGFRVTHTVGSWRVSRGLFTTRETSLADERLAGVTVGEPLGLRLAGAGRLSAIVTGLSRTQMGSSALSPPAPEDVVTGVAAAVLGTDSPVRCKLVDHGDAARRRRFTRALTPAVLLVAAAALIAGVSDVGWWLLVASLAGVLVAVLLGADRARALGHAFTDGYVVARSGSLYRRRDALSVGHVIGWNFRASWWQRRVGLTTLVATTAGGRQSVSVLDVPESTAIALATTSLPHLVDQFRVVVASDSAPAQHR